MSMASARRKGANRIAASNRARGTSTVGTQPSRRPVTALPVATGQGGKRHKARMTGAQRNSEGRRSEWNASPYFANAVTIDARWSA